jgi:plasmid stabilization system protein ParE
MITSVSIHEVADTELKEAARYYESKVDGLGFAFLDEVERVVNLIRDNPESAPRIYKVVRRKILRGFPYSIMYSIVDDSIRILAIANQKRRPFYWQDRQ